MDSNILFLLLALLGARVHAHPWGTGFKIGVSSKAEVKTNTTGKLVPGYDKGVSVDGKGRAEVSGSWTKNIYGQVYAVNSKGEVIGVSGSAGSVVEGSAGAEGGAKLKTNLINTEIDKNGGLDGDASYSAGADVHLIDESEVEGIEGVHTGLKQHSVKQDTPVVVQTKSEKYSNQEEALEEKPKGYLKSVWNWIG